jgi:hypothetical protein
LPLSADTSDAPRFLRITVSGDWPSFDERAAFRRQLISDQHMQPHTRALIDLRGLTSLPAHGDVDAIVAAARREGGIARMLKQSAGPGTLVEIFKDAQEAETLLWNAEPDW